MQLQTNDFQATIPSILFEPTFYLYDFALQPALTKFLIVDELKLTLSPFVDIRFEPFAHGQFTVSTKELFALENHHKIERPRPSFIFHHAFVCSTLLARCLNQIDAFFSLKEPWIYRRLADFKRSHGKNTSPTMWREMFTNYTQLLCKNYVRGNAPIIKMTNVANNLMTEVTHFLPKSKMLYLYSDLESFLISNLKKPKETQDKMLGLAHTFINDENFGRRFPELARAEKLPFLQVCALVWLVNLYNFQTVVSRQAKIDFRTLEMNVLLSDLPNTLAQLSLFFGHTASHQDIHQMSDSEVINKNAKDQSQGYSSELKASEAQQVTQRFGNEIKDAITWVSPLVEKLGILPFLGQYALNLNKHQQHNKQ